MLVCTCQYIYIRLCRKCAVFLLYPCRSSTVNESIQGSGICEDELRFSPLTHTLQYAGFFFSSSSFAFTSKPWKGSHFWPDSLSVFFFFMKMWCFIYLLRKTQPHSWHFCDFWRCKNLLHASCNFFLTVWKSKFAAKLPLFFSSFYIYFSELWT